MLASPDYAMHLQAQLVDLVLELGVPTIPLLTKQDKHTYHVMRPARGQCVADLSTIDKRAAWHNLAQSLRKLHQLTARGAGLITQTSPINGAYVEWETYIKHYLVNHALYCFDKGLFNEKETADILQPFVTWQQNPAVVEGVVLHGDLNDHNLFWNGARVELIDWEDAMIGDPIFELAGWACFTGHPEKEWGGFLEAYYGGGVPEGFWPTFWLYYLRIALSRLVYLHRYKYSNLELGVNRVKEALRTIQGQ